VAPSCARTNVSLDAGARPTDLLKNSAVCSAVAFRDRVMETPEIDSEEPDRTTIPSIRLFYQKWSADRMYLLVPAQALVGQFLKTFEDFPPRQRPSSFSIAGALEKAREHQNVMAAATGVSPRKKAS
jgi:hypothetical protein